MSLDDVTRIRVNQQPIGIIGLKHVMEEMAEEYSDKPDHEVEAELVKRVSMTNYVPEPAREAYGEALLREFNRFLGRPYEDDASEGLEIKVLGPGCARCDKLETEIMGVLNEMDISADVEHIKDLKEMGVFWLGFTGGEPLLQKDIIEITESVGDDCAIKLFTTGCTLTKQLAKDLRNELLFILLITHGR